MSPCLQKYLSSAPNGTRVNPVTVEKNIKRASKGLDTMINFLMKKLVILFLPPNNFPSLKIG
jgi:hypothetical protein